MTELDAKNLAWDKMQGLIPAIVQDEKTGSVLMLAYMNQEALAQTLKTKELTFFSRSKNALWIKGETSGNKLKLVSISKDCDQDALLIQAKPLGPTCHTGAVTCFGTPKDHSLSFINSLEAIIASRKNADPNTSYTAKLLASGLNRIAQKVGEEGVEVALAAVVESEQKLCEELADLLFHVLVLLQAKKLRLQDVIKVLQARHQ